MMKTATLKNFNGKLDKLLENVKARQFYEKHEFQILKFTDDRKTRKIVQMIGYSILKNKNDLKKAITTLKRSETAKVDYSTSVLNQKYANGH